MQNQHNQGLCHLGHWCSHGQTISSGLTCRWSYGTFCWWVPISPSHELTNACRTLDAFVVKDLNINMLTGILFMIINDKLAAKPRGKSSDQSNHLECRDYCQRPCPSSLLHPILSISLVHSYRCCSSGWVPVFRNGHNPWTRTEDPTTPPVRPVHPSCPICHVYFVGSYKTPIIGQKLLYFL